jgi:hypothetical protein
MKTDIKKYLTLILLALLFGLSIGLHLFYVQTLTFLPASLLFLGISLVIFGLLWLFRKTLVYNKFRSLTWKQKRPWLLIALLVSALFMLVFPYEKPVIPTQHSLKVVSVENRYAPEERKVLIQRIYRIRSNEQIPFKDLKLNGWEAMPEGLLSTKTGDTFEYSSEFADGLIIVASASEDAGMLEVTWDGKAERYNLYGPNGADPDTILLPKSSWGTPSVYGVILGVLTIVGDISLVYLSFLVVIFGLMNLKPLQPSKKKISAWMILVYAIPIILVWSLFLLAFWPGVIPYDPLSQLSQAKSGIIYNDHPAINTIYMRMMLSVWDNPAGPIIIRYLILAIVIGYSIYAFRRHGMPGWMGWVLSVLFAISPVTTTTSINLWKDVPYAIVFLLLMVFVFELITSKGVWFKKPLHWVAFGVTAGLTAVIRHNGVLPVAVIFLVGLVIYRRYWLRWVGAILVTAACYFLITKPLYSAFNVQQESAQISIVSKWTGFGLAAYVYHEVDMPTETMLQLDDIIAVKTGWNYDCYSFSRAFGTGNEVFPGGKSFLKLLFDRLISDPGVFIRHWLCNTEHLWRISPNDNPAGHLWAAYVTDINPRTADFFDLNYRSDSKLPQLKPFLSSVVHQTYEQNGLNWFIWRPAFYFYVALGALLISFFRSKNIGYLLMAALIFFQVASIAIGIGSPWVRYSFPTMVTGLLYWPLFFWKPERAAKG